MSQALQFLRSTTAGQRPASLAPGQLAVNLVDKLLFIGDGSDVYTDLESNTSPVSAGGGYFAADLTSATASGISQGYTDSRISELISGAPQALDTLSEIAAALGDDSNFAATITNLAAENTAAINAEAARAAAAEAGLTASLNAEIARAQTAESALGADIAAEEARALAAEAANASAISAEESRAAIAEGALNDSISEESVRAQAAESANAAAIAAVESRALAAEAQLAAALVAVFDLGTF